MVSTKIGAEGLQVVDGQDLHIADSPQAFADAVVQLVRDSALRRRLEESARKLVVERYDWAAVAGQLEDALVRVARGASRESATQELLLSAEAR